MDPTRVESAARCAFPATKHAGPKHSGAKHSGDQTFCGHLTASAKRALSDGKTDSVVIRVDDGRQPPHPRWLAATTAALNSLWLRAVGVEVTPRGNGCQIISHFPLQLMSMEINIAFLMP